MRGTCGSIVHVPAVNDLITRNSADVARGDSTSHVTSVSIADELAIAHCRLRDVGRNKTARPSSYQNSSVGRPLDTADLLNAEIQAAATGTGFISSNPTAAFIEHAVCDDTEWMNDLSNPIVESFHPNRRGHSSGYTLLVGSALIGGPVPVTALTIRTAENSSKPMIRHQRRYAAQDRTIRPKQFKAPNLNSPRIKKAAGRVGVNLNNRASIDRIDAVYATQQARSHRWWRLRIG